MSNPPAKDQSQRQLNHELHDVITILTGLAKNNNWSFTDAMGIITVAGTNRGAVLRMEGPKATAQIAIESHISDGEGTETFANSNNQSINNSIVMGCGCCSDDPGIHLRIEDYVEGLEGNIITDHHETESSKKLEMKMSKQGKSEDEDIHDG